MRFFTAFRESLRRYPEGVHRVGEPADEPALRRAEQVLGGALPAAYREFLGQWNGALLFHETVVLYGVAGAPADLARLARRADALEVGTIEQDTLLIDGRGRVIVRDAETERRAIAGSSFERWLDAVLAREALLYDREGEFREQAFAEGALGERTIARRARAGIKADADAPAWHFELGELLARAGRRAPALAALERAVTLDPTFAEAWFAVAGLHEEGGEPAQAVAAYERAAAGEETDEEAAFALARAAHAARRAGEAQGAERLALECLRLAPGFVDEQVEAARHFASLAAPEPHEIEAALERLSLAQAVAPQHAEVARLVALTRSRLALRPR